jgi:hypothetical protein
MCCEEDIEFGWPLIYVSHEDKLKIASGFISLIFFV